MAATPVKAILFDMDGLLLDTERIALACFQSASTSLGYPLRQDILNRLVGRNSRDADQFLQASLGARYPAEAVRQQFRQRYERHLAEHGVNTKPGLIDLIRFLDQHQLPRMVATSTRREMAEWKLSRAGILQYFAGVTGGDEVERGKPAPDIFLLAASRLGIAPESCLVLEDSGPGIQAALSAGMRAVLIPDIVSPDIRELHKGVQTASTLAEIPKLLETYIESF